MTVQTDFDLHEYNTLKIPAICSYFAQCSTSDACREVLNEPRFADMKKFVLGSGANILFADRYDGLVIHPIIQGIRVITESETDVLVESGSGESWHGLVTFAVDHDWGGIENLALIPGTVGAAPIQNIAAYGQNLSDTFDSLVALEIATGAEKEFSKEMCQFDYRDSIFKRDLQNKYIITSVRLKLRKNPKINTEYWSKKHGSVGQELEKQGPGPYTIKAVYTAVVSLRTKKFPDMRMIGTAGSFFKNPLVTKEKLNELLNKVPTLQFYPAEELRYTIQDRDEVAESAYFKIAAGGILDEGLGYAGRWDGNVGLYEKHALILVTNGRATGHEVLAFAETIQKDFYEYCGVKLEREVLYVE